MPTTVLQNEPMMTPIFAVTNSSRERPSDAMKKAEVKPMPPIRAIAPDPPWLRLYRNVLEDPNRCGLAKRSLHGHSSP